MKNELPPNVCIDGNAARRIREEKKLTQLYVAKVVGVTTDTISRWENNRYPTIKRDNVLKLAEALEVEVVEILSTENPQAESEELVSTDDKLPRRKTYLVWLIFLLAVAASFLWWLLTPGTTLLTIKAKRLLPGYAAPGTVIPVQIQIEREEGEGGFILREHFPKGWKLIESLPPASSLDNVDGSARWIVRPGDHRTLFAYQLRVEVGEQEQSAIGSFTGEVVAGPGDSSRPVLVNGADHLRVAPFLWADLNGDQKIDDGEMLQAADWVDQMQGLHIDWSQLEKIWDAGGYRWDDKKKAFVPEKRAEQENPSKLSQEPG